MNPTQSFETEVIERLTKIEGMLEHDYDAIHGTANTPGLLATVQSHELRLNTIETTTSQRKHDWSTVAVVVAFLIQSVLSIISMLAK